MISQKVKNRVQKEKEKLKEKEKNQNARIRFAKGSIITETILKASSLKEIERYAQEFAYEQFELYGYGNGTIEKERLQSFGPCKNRQEAINVVGALIEQKPGTYINACQYKDKDDIFWYAQITIEV